MPHALGKITTNAFLNGQRWGKPKARENPTGEPYKLCGGNWSRATGPPCSTRGAEGAGGRAQRKAEHHCWCGKYGVRSTRRIGRAPQRKLCFKNSVCSLSFKSILVHKLPPFNHRMLENQLHCPPSSERKVLKLF